jgi:hypothetical protein
MVSNNNKDILREARELLENPPPRHIFRRAYLDGPARGPDPWAPEPEPPGLDDLAPERRQAQPQPATWGPWEAWIAARIESALVEERERTAEVMAEALGLTIARERKAAAEAMREQVRGLRDDLSRAEAALQQLHRLVEIERHKVLDIPALPLSHRDVN